jgi:hypothetical protein
MSLYRIVREEVLRAVIFFTTIFVLAVVSFGGIAYAVNTDGGLFGEILDKILASWDWKNAWDGTVRNANNLGGTPASGFQKINPWQNCPANQCIYSITAAWNISCR